MSKTTANMEDVLENTTRSVARIREILLEEFTESAIQGFWEAMRLGGAKPDVADEYFNGLRHAIPRITEALAALDRDIGSAHHIVATGTARTPLASQSGARRHLVL